MSSQPFNFNSPPDQPSDADPSEAQSLGSGFRLGHTHQFQSSQRSSFNTPRFSFGSSRTPSSGASEALNFNSSPAQSFGFRNRLSSSDSTDAPRFTPNASNTSFHFHPPPPNGPPGSNALQFDFQPSDAPQPQHNQFFSFNTPQFSFNSPPGGPFRFGNPRFQSQPFSFTSHESGRNPQPQPDDPGLSSSQLPPTTTTPATTPLCPCCAALDLETALARAHALYEGARRGLNSRQLVTCRGAAGITTNNNNTNPVVYLRDFYFVTSLGRRLNKSSKSAAINCALCDFFRSHVPAPERDVLVFGGSYKVLAVCASESHLFQAPRKDAKGEWLKRKGWEGVEHNVFLAVVPDVEGVPRTGVPLRWLETGLPRAGGIYRLTAEEDRVQRLVLPREVGIEADMKWAEWSLACCRRDHLACCAPRKPPGATMRGFRVVDCEQNPPVVVEMPWSEKYVALSYVWGTSKEDWPKTVTDAVHVTRSLGEKYLWVDRLCIDQSNYEEKMALIERMNDIYAGAEFTIVNAAGDARTGLPGVLGTPRTRQPRVELDHKPTNNTDTVGPGRGRNQPDEYLELLNVPEAEYNQETEGHSMWLDTFRHGLNSVMKIDLSELLVRDESEERARKYNIPLGHLDFYEDSAEKLNIPFEEFMKKQTLLATKLGITLRELVPWLQRKAAANAGRPIPDNQPLPALTRPEQYATSPVKPALPLPPDHTHNKTILLSTMSDPRHVIRESLWATRGWTYQEGVLSTRRLVFTPHQLYWECNGMALQESTQLPVPALHVPSADGTHRHFADYMLSGVFRGDMRAAPELQYGFRDEAVEGVDGEVRRLDAHIRAFTGRRLTDVKDSLNAFLGVAARYAPGRDGGAGGLALVQGIPVWMGVFADGRSPALQHTFAFSVSVWFHVARPVARRAELYVADRPRRGQFPSWSLIGWEGVVDFNGDNTQQNRAVEEDSDEEDEEDNMADNAHVEFFMAMLSPEWVTSIDRLWSAQMVLHSEDGSHSTLLSGRVPNLDEFAGGGKSANKKWLLTIKDPLVLKHLYLMHSSCGRWRRLMGKTAELHLSVSMTEEELTQGHKAGNLLSVLIFAGTVPFVWDGRARYLILRRVAGADTRWERIGRLVLTMEEWMMDRYKDSGDMVRDLPVKKFGKDIILV